MLIVGVWLLQRNEQDRPFNDRINVPWCYLSYLDDLLMKEEEGKGVKPVLEYS